MNRILPIPPLLLLSLLCLGFQPSCAGGPSVSRRAKPGLPIQVQVQSGGRVVTIVNRSYFAKKMGSRLRNGWSVVSDSAMGVFVTEEEKLGFFRNAAKGSLGGTSRLRMDLGGEIWTLPRPRLSDPQERRLRWPRHLSLAFQLFNIGDTSMGSAGLGAGGKFIGEELRRLRREKSQRKKILQMGKGR
jgi:hypothetical protein